MFRTLILLLSFAYSSFSGAETIRFTSGENRVQLLELYSSQGCSSCPPAQQWVNQLQHSPALWKQVIPVVFHVDYWDYLGWKDPFSKPQFSFRQRAHKRQGNVNSVYTPGFVVNGKEWKGWFQGRELNMSDSKAGILAFTLSRGVAEKTQFTATFSPHSHTLSSHLTLTVALLGMNSSTRVSAGENRARQLQESFIVLELLAFASSQQAPENSDATQTTNIVFTGVMPQHINANAIAVWVSEKDSLHPIQSTGGYLYPNYLKILDFSG